MQNLSIVFDISSIIWDESDYYENEEEYYGLVDGFTEFLTRIESEKIKVLLSSTLQTEMMASFPYGKPPYYNSSFEKQTLSFLSKVEVSEFPVQILPEPQSFPELVKNYYNETTKTEMRLLISKIHSENEGDSKFFTFHYLWDNNSNLRTESELRINTYETIVADNCNDLDDFLKNYRPTFEHNPKHDKKSNNSKEKWLDFDDKDAFNSRLSCYNGYDNIQPQKILENSYPHMVNNEYIGYDETNEVYVRFKCHKDNLYHGFDEYDIDNIDKIPIRVREHFNK